jgi:hypothetical protein
LSQVSKEHVKVAIVLQKTHHISGFLLPVFLYDAKKRALYQGVNKRKRRALYLAKIQAL